MTAFPPQPSRRRLLVAGSVGAATAAAAGLPMRLAVAAPRQPVDPPFDVGYVFLSPIGKAGWSYQHNLGRLALEKALPDDVRTRYVENVAEGADAERVIRDLATQGCKLVFATSFDYMDSVIKVARSFPDQAFEHATGYKMADNVAVYSARFYQGRYLTGLVAGQMCRSHVIGYIAAMPLPEVLQGINAFTIGARAIDPRIRVRVIWTNAWNAPDRERDAVQSAIDRKADLVTHHTDSPTVCEAAEAKGIYCIGCHSNMAPFAPKRHLVSVTDHWDAYYVSRARALLEGNWTVGNWMGSLADNAVRLEGMSAQVPQHIQQLVARRAREIIDGKRHPFLGPVVDNEGRIRIAGGAVLDDDQLSKMDWLVEGVIGSV